MGVLRYFDPSVETVIQTDASQKGLGAVLLQQGQPVCYALKALRYREKLQQMASANGQLLKIHVHHITQNFPASPTRLQQIRNETKKDPTLSLLKETVFEGWPQKREKCPPLLHDYWNFREELTVEDGLLLKGDRILIPPTLRPEILDIIHQGHLGQEKCLLRARTCVFWPGNYKGYHQ